MAKVWSDVRLAWVVLCLCVSAVKVQSLECNQGLCEVTCDPVTGCSRCTMGYKVPTCYGCAPGRWGFTCEKACSDTCLGGDDEAEVCSRQGGECTLGCKASYHGGQCQSVCNSGCGSASGSTTCDRTTGQCNHGCNHGYYGEECNKVCGERCKDSDGEAVCERESGACVNCTGRYGPDCELDCSLGCLRSGDVPVCEKVTGVCTEGCRYPPYQTWYTGQPCNLTMDYVEYPRDSHVVEVTNITSESVVVVWPHVEDIPSALSDLYGYRVSALDVDNKRSQGLPVELQANLSTYSVLMSGLAANTTYEMTVQVCRLVPGTDPECSRNSSAVFPVTTLPATTTDDQAALIGAIAGGAAGLVLLIVGGVMLIVVLLRRRRRIKVDVGVVIGERPGVENRLQSTGGASYNPAHNGKLELRGFETEESLYEDVDDPNLASGQRPQNLYERGQVAEGNYRRSDNLYLEPQALGGGNGTQDTLYEEPRASGWGSGNTDSMYEQPQAPEDEYVAMGEEDVYENM